MTDMGKNQKLQTKEQEQQSPNQSVKEPSHQTCRQSCCSLKNYDLEA